uniref:Uncharacterized protein n=1 Tax=Romanomermis culicivorax TaxID=13658 RepID=A0A915JRZ6_ROMCU
MVAVVILVFCQVIPREAKRLFELIYPVDYTMACMEVKNRLREQYHGSQKDLQMECTCISYASPVPEIRHGRTYHLQVLDKSDGRTVHERLFCFHLFAYGHLFTKLLLNTLTAANRSLVFYVYFALNRCFRKAVLQTFGFERRTSSRRRQSHRRRRSSEPPRASLVGGDSHGRSSPRME